MKKSFILYVNVCESILSLLDNGQAGALFRAIVDYANGKETEITDQQVLMAYTIITAKMKEDAEAYEEICEKRREYGRKGGISKAKLAKGSKSKQMQANASISQQGKQKLASVADIDIDNDIDIEYKDTNVSMNTIKEDTNVSLSISKIDYPKLLAFFNAELENRNSLIPRIKSLSDARKKALHARMREHGKKSIRLVIQKAAQSDFLNGKNNHQFIASFDWLMKPTNFPKVLEGNYDNPEKPAPRTQSITTLIDNSKLQREQKEQREKEQKLRILSIYDAAQKGDVRATEIINGMRKNGTLEKYGLT